MADESDTLQLNLSVLAKRLPRNAVRALVAELGHSEESKARAGQARRALIGELNTPRPYRARRLFTGLVEALLTDDEALTEAGGPEVVPGLLQRADIAGLWAALLSCGLGALAERVQAALDALCVDAVIEDVFLRPDVIAMQNDMARQAVALIDAAAAERAKQDRFLKIVNDARRADILAQRGWSDGGTGLTWRSVQNIRDLLHHIEIIGPALDALARQIPVDDGDGPVAEGEGRTVLETMERLRRDQRIARSESAAVYTAGIALHRRHRYDVAEAILREAPPVRGSVGAVVSTALCGHLKGVGRSISRRLRSATVSRDNAGIELDEHARATLDALLRRYGRILEAIVKSGLIEEPDAKFLVRECYAELPAAIEGAIIPSLIRRIRASSTAAARPLDHADVVRLSAWLSNWLLTVKRATLAGATIENWYDSVIADLRREWDATVKLDDRADRLMRMERLARIHELVTSLGGSTTDWLMVISVNTIAIIQGRLERAEPLSAAERDIAANYLALVEAEIKRTRHWQIPELIAFREAARSRV